MSNYFNAFPRTLYLFGNEEQPVSFQKISAQSDLINEIIEDAGTYVEYQIRDGDRPDTLSNTLYGRNDYDWTFFSANKRLRETGWPMTTNQVYERADSEFFPNFIFRLNIETSDSAAEYASLYPVGQKVLVSGVNGTVVAKNLDTGEITISSDSDLIGGTTLAYKPPFLGDSEDNTVGAAGTVVYEYQGIHHYENDSGEWLDRWFDNVSFATLKTNLDYLIDQNDESRSIRVIKADLIDGIVARYKARISES